MSRNAEAWDLGIAPTEEHPVATLERYHQEQRQACQDKLTRANQKIAQLEAEVMRLRLELANGR